MSTTSTVVATDGTELFERRWPARGDRRGTVVLLHGLGEHTGRYEHVGDALAGAGFEVIGRDLRGHGNTGSGTVYVESFDRLLADVDQAISDARSEADVPVVLLGHSLGGLLAVASVQSDRSPPDLLVLSAPAIRAEIPLVKRLAARVLTRLAPRLTVPNDLTGDQLSRDPAVGEAYFADPLVVTSTTTRFAAEALAAQRRLGEGLQPFGIPVLVIHGGADPIVPPQVSAPLAELEGVERHLFPAFRHESFNEEGGVPALAVVTDWLERQTSPA
ncbi:MAG: alpha/beta hydrolase [Acidimicrobiia bacterium]|nr:alpha/beta hydrolase [Acidimicrobiia bacterium]